jgi:hypothetical protein
MKNKDVLLKIIIIFGSIIFLLLLVIILSFIKIITPKENVIKEKEVIEKSYSLSDIRNVTFDFKKSNSIFKVSNNKELIIIQNSKEDKFFLKHKQKGNDLYFEEDSYLLGLQVKKYTIYFPKEYLNKITIVNGFGEVDIAGISNDIDINNNSGNIILKEIGNIQIKDVSGAISFKNAFGDINVSSTTGNITVENLKGRLNIETITGDIIVNKFIVTGNSNIENVSGNILLKIDDSSICKINLYNETGKIKINERVCSSDTNIINVKNVTGLIDIY